MTNVAQVLNERFDCSRCHASGSWVRAARPQLRQTSRIHRLRCACCGEQIVAKVSRGRDSEVAHAELRTEYQMLRVLESAFPHDDQHGTLAALGYIDFTDRGIMITRLFRGMDLVRYSRRLDPAVAQATFREAGVWLRKFHESDRSSQQLRSLGVPDKIDYLKRTYGSCLRSDSKTSAACELLTRSGARIDTLALSAAKLHGDFKPENLLFDGTRCVGLDMHWQTIGAVVYDIAPFLNHLWLAESAAGRWRASDRYLLAENAFLRGYGGSVEMYPLRWAQLYFALSYLGRYRRRGILAAGYASLNVWPMVREAANQLQQVA